MISMTSNDYVYLLFPEQFSTDLQNSPIKAKTQICLFYIIKMSIEDYNRKHLFGSLDKNKIPANLTQYSCNLIIQDYLQGRQASQIKYFKFTPKQGSSAEPFCIEIDNIAPTSHLVYAYRINEEEQKSQFILGEKQQYKMQTSIKVAPKPISNMQNIQQEEDQYYPDQDMEIRVLQLGDDDSSDQSSSSKCMEPSDGDKGRIKAELIQYFHIQTNRMSKLKQIRTYLYQRGYKVAQARLKTLLNDICKISSDKKAAYALKDQFIEKDDYQRKNPKKKIKEE